MDQIGGSHITLPDMLICGVAIFLVIELSRLSPKSPICRIVAALCGCIVIGILVVLFVVDLNKNAVWELSMVAFVLCVSLWQWNDKIKSTRATVTSPETSR